MTIQSSIQIGNVIRNAIVSNIRNWLGGMMNSDSLIQSVQDFFTVLEERKIDYVLVGIYENDIATLIHYYQPDMTSLLGELSGYVDEKDFAEIKGVVSDIQSRIKRFKNESR